MKTVSKMKSMLLAMAVMMSASVLITPVAEAHACYGAGAITIRPGSKPGEFWYYQNNKVCGRFVT